MNGSDLTKQQAEQLLARLWPMLRYIKALRDRMERRSFPKDDKLSRLVARIHDDMHELSVSLHYLTCDGVGRPSRQQKQSCLREREPPFIPAIVHDGRSHVESNCLGQPAANFWIRAFIVSET